MNQTSFRGLRLTVALIMLIWAQFALAQAVAENTARVHYFRPDAAYEGFELHVWEDTTDEVSWDAGLAISGRSDYGVYWDINLIDNAKRVGFIVHKGDEKDPGPDMFLELAKHGNEIWLQSGSDEILSAPPLAAPAERTARVHYYRPDGAYEGFELHVWEDTTESVTWENGLVQTGSSAFGVYWDVALAEDASTLGFIVHKGDEKDPGPDMFLDLTESNEVWLVSGSARLFTQKPDIQVAGSGDLSKAQAYWLERDLFAWNLGTVVPDTVFSLHASADASLALSEAGVMNGEAFELVIDERGLPEHVIAKFPHLADYTALRLYDFVPEFQEQNLAAVPRLLQGQLAISMTNANKLLDATGLQIAGVLDDLYAEEAYTQTLGVSWQEASPNIAVWAPTAQTVKLHLFESASSQDSKVIDMKLSAAGVWSVTGDSSWRNKYYLFEVKVFAPSTLKIETNLVTDPYSLALSLNSKRSQMIDLSSAEHKPEGWDELLKEGLSAPEKGVIYELHIRDFSVNDPTVSQDKQGTYLAFTENSNGMKHLANISAAGLTHLHLLPSFDIATINEDKSTWQTPAIPSTIAPSSTEAQAAIDALRDADAFNWGYDPFHFNVPEGSYAVNPDKRSLEYRQMVKSLADIGLLTVMDVVYNHTNASGQAEKSVLDKIVPGYYHRLSKDGFVETSTCCQNTATEHAMMEKLMIDSVLLWAKDYKVDAFRFDLMGHHMVSNMLALRQALDELTLENDGVNGKNIYLYGEGWNFGEVANNARGVHATQVNLAGTGIGTFSDRLRDAVRGGGPFDNGLDLIRNQGFTSGRYYLPNERVTASEETQKDILLQQADQIRVGLAGNLADYRFKNRLGETVTGKDIDYNGSATGYTQDPQEHIVYISKHDNQTFWDFSQYKLPEDVSIKDRVRMHNVGLDIVMFSQGIPFFQAGDDMLRSKSFDRNSYNSGDYFNRLDFSYESNNFGVGLPPASENRTNWNFMRPLLENPNLKPAQEDILTAVNHFQTMLSIRQSSALFSLETAEDINARLEFHNTGLEQVPGVIVMSLADNKGLADLDPKVEVFVVVFNATNKRQTLKVDALEGLDLRLHSYLQAQQDDPVLTSAHYAFNNSLSVPAYTTAVFYQAQK